MVKIVSKGILPLLGRLLVACIFATSAYSKAFFWAGNMEYMNGKHLPMPGLLLAAALAVETLLELAAVFEQLQFVSVFAYRSRMQGRFLSQVLAWGN